MPKRFYIGYDSGTMGTKVAIYTIEGELVADAYREHEILYPKPGWAEMEAEQFYRVAADGIKECLDYAGEKGVVLGLENHGGITARAEDHLAICDAVGEHPWFGVNLDTGNYRTNPYEELAMAAPRSVNVQVKVEVADESGNSEPTDLAKIRDILIQANYKGWVALEYEAKEDPLVAIPRYIKQLQELFA